MSGHLSKSVKCYKTDSIALLNFLFDWIPSSLAYALLLLLYHSDSDYRQCGATKHKEISLPQNCKKNICSRNRQAGFTPDTF